MLEKFVVFEGIDGSGKSTQIPLIHRYLTEKGQQCYSTKEPTDGPIGTIIKSHSKGISPPISLEQQASLFARDRHQHLYSKDGIVERIQMGWWCLCDRYLFSSLVYQGNIAQRFNMNFPLPKWVFFFHLPIHLIEERLSSRSSRDIYEEKSFLVKAQGKYKEVLSHLPSRGVRVVSFDSSLSVGHIHQQIRCELDPWINL